MGGNKIQRDGARRIIIMGFPELADNHLELNRTEDVPLVEFMYLAFSRMPGETESYHRRHLCFCDVFRELINSLVC